MPAPTAAATHNNLFTNLDCGLCQRPWKSGGDKTRGAQSGEGAGLHAGGGERWVKCKPLCFYRLRCSPSFSETPMSPMLRLTPCICIPPTAAANTTWWGVYSSLPATPPPPLPECTFGPLLNWVGSFAPSAQPGACAYLRWTVEQAGARRLVPSDLLVAQRARRRLRPV